MEAQLADFAQTVKAGSRTELAMLYRLRDMLLSQRAYLTAMADYTAHGGKSRGSALHTDLTGWVKPFGQLPDTFTFALDETEAPLIQELWFEDGTCRTAWRAPRPIPGMTTFLKTSGAATARQGTLTENTNYINMCRTQVRIRMNTPAEYFLKNPLGNHHIMLHGNYEDTLNEFFQANACKRME